MDHDSGMSPYSNESSSHALIRPASIPMESYIQHQHHHQSQTHASYATAIPAEHLSYEDTSALWDGLRNFSQDYNFDLPLAGTPSTYANVETTSSGSAGTDFIMGSVPQSPSNSSSIRQARAGSSGGGGALGRNVSTREQDLRNERKERRRAQNRSAQRTFRARKEDLVKAVSVRLETSQGELARLKDQSADLSHLVEDLRAEVARLEALVEQLCGTRTPSVWSLEGAKRERQRSLSESMADVGVGTEVSESVREKQKERSGKERDLEIAAMANGLF